MSNSLRKIMIMVVVLKISACHHLGIKTVGSIENERESWNDSKDSVNEAIKILNHKFIPKIELKIPINIQSTKSIKVSKISKNKYSTKFYDTKTIKELNDRNSYIQPKS